MTDSIVTKDAPDETGLSGHDAGRGKFGVTVLFQEQEIRLSFTDPIVEGRKVLREAELESPDDYVLIALAAPGSRSIGLDEEVDLREAGREVFRAFRADRVFSFTVDERGYEWGAPHIDEAMLRQIAGVEDGQDLVLEREDEPDEIIRKGTTVDLDARGTEHIRARKRPDTFEVTVIYNGLKKPMAVTNSELIKNVLERAIALFGSLPNPHTLSLFTADRGELKDEWTVRAAGVTPHEEVLLRPSTVKAG